MKKHVSLMLLLAMTVLGHAQEVTNTEATNTIEGTNTVEATQTDDTNTMATTENMEAVETNTAPLVGYTVTNQNIYYASPNARFEITGEDALSGLKEIQVSVNGSDYAEYKYPISFSKEGEYTINYQFIDRVGNKSYAQPYSVTVDATAPRVLSPMFFPMPFEASGFSYVGPSYQLGFKSHDDASGMAFVEFAFDTNALAVYEDTNTNTLASFGLTNTKAVQLFYQATDKVSNVTAIKSNTYMLDATAPIVNVFAKVVEIDGVRYISSKTPIFVDAFDADTKVQTVTYRIEADTLLEEEPATEMMISNEILTNEDGTISTNTITNTVATSEVVPEATTNVAVTEEATTNDIATTEEVSTNEMAMSEETNQAPVLFTYDAEIGILLTEAGKHTVYVQAVDMVGNVSEEVAYEVMVDMVSPEGNALYIGEVSSKEYNKIEMLNQVQQEEATEVQQEEKTEFADEIQENTEVVAADQKNDTEATVTETETPETASSPQEIPAGTELN